MEAVKRFSSNVIKVLKNAICDANGNEIFASGTINSEGIVISVDIGARGNNTSVIINESLRRKADVLIHNHPSGVLTPSDADLVAASQASANMQGFCIIDNSVANIYMVVEPITSKVVKRIDPEYSSEYLKSNSNFAKNNKYFEERESQIAMLKEVCKVFNNNKVGVFEAGTGVGKSFAYLIPSILWALQNNERVVISTGTINLEQQLVEKDIPAVEKVLNKSVQYKMMKGRQNYICLRRLNDVVNEKDLFTEDNDEMDKIKQWISTTGTGSRSDLTFMPTEGIWQRINSESDACMGMRCLYYEQCFVMKSKKEAADAQILVTNHHLLFSDIQMRLAGAGYEDTAVLPPYKRLVLDEAHGIESAATSFFSETVTRFNFIKQLNLLYRQKKGSAVGLLFTLDALSASNIELAEVITCINELKDIITELETSTLTLLENSYSFRIYTGTATESKVLLEKMEKIAVKTADLTGMVRQIIGNIAEKDVEAPPVWEIKQILRRIDNSGSLCRSFLDWEENQNTVYWIEKRKLNNAGWYPKFIITPLDISDTMNEGVFEPMDSVICTSATLRINNDFSYWMKRCGLYKTNQEKLSVSLFDSPFQYSKNVLLAIPTDAPVPSDSSFQTWIEHNIIRLIQASNGRSLVLFTSYDSLSYTCDFTRNTLKSSGITVLKQGDDDRFRLLKAFQNDVSSVLFATDSFWEGVDVPGEALSQVIIVKLPFSVPSDPVFAARSENIKKKGGSDFMELSVPDAVMHFRQGFGRLIRRASDKGVVVILDNRIITKRYGQIFLQSIPETIKLIKPLQEICRNIQNFLK